MPTKAEDAHPGIDTRGSTPVDVYIRSAFTGVVGDVRELKTRFDQLTQVLPSEGEGVSEFTSLSPGLMLSEENLALASKTPEVKALRDAVREQESMVTEEAKTLVDAKISELVKQVSDVQKARGALGYRLDESYTALKTLNVLTERANDVFVSLSESRDLQAHYLVHLDKVLSAEDKLKEVKRTNVNLVREIFLYTLGFK